jgi:hypothetical protein
LEHGPQKPVIDAFQVLLYAGADSPCSGEPVYLVVYHWHGFFRAETVAVEVPHYPLGIPLQVLGAGSSSLTSLSTLLVLYASA